MLDYKKAEEISNLIYKGDYVSLLLLWEELAEIDANENFLGTNFLSTACYKGHEQIVNFLIEKGADVNKSSGDSRPPLYYAATKKNCYNILEILLKNGAIPDISSIIHIINKQDIPAIRLLLKYGIKLNDIITDDIFKNPLPLWARVLCLGDDQNEKIGIVKLFLQHGANPDSVYHNNKLIADNLSSSEVGSYETMKTIRAFLKLESAFRSKDYSQVHVHSKFSDPCKIEDTLIKDFIEWKLKEPSLTADIRSDEYVSNLSALSEFIENNSYFNNEPIKWQLKKQAQGFPTLTNILFDEILKLDNKGISEKLKDSKEGLSQQLGEYAEQYGISLSTLVAEINSNPRLNYLLDRNKIDQVKSLLEDDKEKVEKADVATIVKFLKNGINLDYLVEIKHKKFINDFLEHVSIAAATEDKQTISSRIKKLLKIGISTEVIKEALIISDAPYEIKESLCNASNLTGAIEESIDHI